jgi:hypothetical protein
MATVSAVANSTLPGSVRVSVVAEPGEVAGILRSDGVREAQPVRNVDGTGPEIIMDCEAPLGRPVKYSLVDATGKVIAVSAPVTCPDPGDGRALLRSVLYPQVMWMWCRPLDNTGMQHRSSTTVYDIPGSDTPVVIGEVRQRPTGTLSLYAGSIEEAEEIVELCSDGTALLIRFPLCSGTKSRDMLFYALDISENRYSKGAGRIVAISYQASRFVPGRTLEPPDNWNFEALHHSAPDFASLAARYQNFGAMAVDQPRSA